MSLSTPSASPPAAAEPSLAPERDDAPETIIRPRRGWVGVDWRELLAYRELLYFLVWRDLKVRYKQAMLGFAWAILAPLIQVAIFTIVFGKAGGFDKNLPSGVGSYPVYIFAGLIPWMMIAQAISAGGLSLVNQQALLSKIYMPRLFIPAAVIGGSLADMAISYGVFACLMFAYGVTPAWTIVFLPLLIGLNIMLGLGLAMSLASVTIMFRDLRFLIPFMVQLLMLISAVAYPSMVLREWPWLLYLNPIAGLLDAFRAATFTGMTVNWPHLGFSIAFTGVMFCFGLFHFRRTERRFADIA